MKPIGIGSYKVVELEPSKKLKFHPAPIVLGLILGPFIEEGLVQSMLAGQAAGGVLKYMIFRPISLILIFMSLMSALWPLYTSWRGKRRIRLKGRR